MPNSLGLYSLLELEVKTRAVIWGTDQPVDPNTGLPIGNPTYDTLISKVDVDDQINRAYTSAWLQVQQLAQDAYVRTIYISTKAGLATYALPPDAAVFHTIHWRHFANSSGSINVTAGVPPQPAFPARYVPMPRIDDDQPEHFHGGSAPPWHRDGQQLVLDRVPNYDNPQGIRIRYVPWFQQLVQPTDTLTGQLARPMQEVVIYGAAIELCKTKRRTVTQDMQASYKTYLDLLMVAAGNIEKPDRAQMVSPYPVKGSFSGRGRRRGRW
jgi:hypothetical protein